MSKARDLSKLLTDGLSSVLADNSIGLPKLSNITTDRLVGRDTAGTGAVEQIQVTGGLEFTDAGSLRTTAFTGDVTKTAGGTALTIAADAVTTAKILNGNVTAAKVNTGEVAVLGAAQQYTRTHNFTATPLTFASTVTWDLSLAQVAVLTLTGAATMGTPSAIAAGAVYILIVKQDAGGGKTLSFPFGSTGVTGYRFAGATTSSGAPTLSTGGGKIDVITFVANTHTDGTTHLYGVSSLNYA
jgi:hypothetical protein